MYALIAVMLVAGLLMVYAHTYVDVHWLSRVPEDQAVAQRAGSGGTYTFDKGESEWVLAYTVERPSDSNGHDGYIWAYLYKTVENRSLSSPQTGMRVAGASLSPINDVQLRFDPARDVVYSGNCTAMRIDLFFDQNGTYPISLNVNLQFYQHPVIGILPMGEVSVPINATVVVNPRS